MAKKGHIPWNKGIPQTEAVKEKLRESKLGKKHSADHKRKISEKMKGRKASLETRRKMSVARSGSGSALWRGGLTKINKKIRMGLEYRLWREAVFKRDKYTCIFCGESGRRIVPDHIKPFAYFPELRFAIDNGRTLCDECHKKTDSYGSKCTKNYGK